MMTWLEETLGGLPCRVLLPEPYEPHARRYPLVVSLHGSGERGTDNRAQLKNGLATFEARQRSHPCIVVAPQLPRGETIAGGLLLATFVALGGCRKHASSGDPTADWFADHRRDLDKSRAMLIEDHGLVTSITLGPLGGVHTVGGAKGQCGSRLRGADFPWDCAGGVVAKSLDEVAAFLGVSGARLRQYERALPASVSSGEPCAPAGSFVFWIEDPDSSPCTGRSNIVWSPVPPVVKTDGSCRRTVEKHYVPLGDGWYADACAARPTTTK